MHDHCVNQGFLANSFKEARSVLKAVFLKHNRLSGSIVVHIRSRNSLRIFDLGRNKLTGTLPESIAHLLLVGLLLPYNRLSGRLPPGGIVRTQPNNELQALALEVNLFSGSIPDTLTSPLRLRALRFLSLQGNRLTGSFAAPVLSLETLELSENQLTGALPQSLRGVSALRIFRAQNNMLRSSIPTSAISLISLEWLELACNGLIGAIPSSLSFLSKLSVLILDNNDLAGTLPDSLGAVQSLMLLDCKRNAWEGVLPGSFEGLANLKHWLMSGEEEGPKLRGSIPARFARIRHLATILCPFHQLQGFIPAFSSTVVAIALHENAFQHLPILRMSNTTAWVFLQRNHLSCTLSSDNVSHALNVALVALGNHLTRPEGENFPAWVSPIERDGLFWRQQYAGYWVLMRALVSCGSLLFCVALKVGRRRLQTITLLWHVSMHLQGALAKISRSLFCFMASQTPGCCLLLMLVAASEYYVCPGALALGSACLLRSFPVHAMSILLWCRFSAEAQRPFWISMGAIHPLAFRKVRLKVLVRASSMWVCWILAVTMLSALVVTNMAAKSIPSFLPVSGPWIGRVEVCIGLFQGILSGVLLPSLAGLVSSKGGARRPALVSVATMLITFFIPALAVLYLDGACLDRWTLWWPPCTDTGQHMFNIEAPVQVHKVEETRTILHHRDVCTPKGHQSVSSCTRSVALHLQGLILSKLLTAAFSLPTARLVWGKYCELTDTVVVKLALLLELGMLLGPSLPVIIPLLSIGVLTERMLAAVSWDAGFLQSVSRRGDARFAIAATGMCSLVFYGCFVFDSTPACVLLLLAFVMLLKGKVAMANVWRRHPPPALLKGRRVSTYGTEHRPS